MNRHDWTIQLFKSIDDQDTEAFASYLADDVVFRFGNAEPAIGKETTKAAVGGFFGSIRALRHDLADIWAHGDSVICHGTVTYTRHDSSALAVPFATVFKMEADLIKDYLIFVDVSGLYKET